MTSLNHLRPVYSTPANPFRPGRGYRPTDRPPRLPADLDLLLARLVRTTRRGLLSPGAAAHHPTLNHASEW